MDQHAGRMYRYTSREYKNTVIKNIRKKIKATGTGLFPKTKDIKIEDFIPDGFDPYPVQKLTADLVEKFPDFDLTLIEALMGEGKTQAGFFAAMKAAKEKGLQGLYFALPTKATAEGMVARIVEMLGCIDIKEKVNLATGNAWSSEFMDGSEEAMALYHTIGSRLLASFSVGTIDQALFSICKTRFNDISLSAISNLVLVIDEVHAYDAYMMTEIKRLLKWMKSFHCPVVLLSATLTDKMKRDLFSVYGVDEKIRTGYPLVSVISEGNLIQETCTGASRKAKFGIRIERWFSDIGKIAENALAMIENGGNLLVCVNTVDRANAIYDQIKSKKPDDIEVTLFHARTSEGYKEQRGKFILDKYGKEGKKKGNRPKKSIVVATSIISESMDVDFDYLICDIKPIDILIQTIGRIRRHDDAKTVRENSGYKNEIVILVPNETEWEKCFRPYNLDVLISTYKTLSGKNEIILPNQIRDLINTVYENAGENWQTEEHAKRAISEINIIPSPSKRDFTHDRDTEQETDRKTRLQSYDTVNITVLEDDDKNIESKKEYILKWRTVKNVPDYLIPEELKDDSFKILSIPMLKDNIVLTKSEAQSNGISITEELGLRIIRS